MIQEISARLHQVKVYEGIASADQMYNPQAGLSRYLSVGRSGLRVVLTALIGRIGHPGVDTPIQRILDFGSGFGRVTRFLCAAFPEAMTSVVDLNNTAVDWCVDKLGVSPVTGSIPNNTYDLIFLGSVLTHISAEKTCELLESLPKALCQNGLLIFTAQGRFAARDIKSTPQRKTYNLGDEQRKKLVRDYRATGYGFVEYAPGRGYGVSLINHQWIDAQMAEKPEITQIMFHEKGYDHHQDVYAYLSAPILGQRRSGL